MRKMILLAASMLMLTIAAFADVIVEPDITESSSASGITLVFVGAAVVCVAVAVLVWFVRKKK